MIKLLQLEWLKYKPNNAFWVLLALFVILQAFVLYGLDNFAIGFNGEKGSQGINFKSLAVSSFPKVWVFYSYIAGFFKIVPAVAVIMLLCNEFEFRTFRQNMIDGLSRSQVVTSKLLTTIAFSLFSGVLLFLLIGIFSASLQEGQSFFENSEFILAYTLQNFGYLSMAFLLALLIRKTGLAIIIILMYSFIIEPIANYNLEDIGAYLPLETFGLLIRSPFTSIVGSELQSSIDLAIVGRSFLYICIFWASSYYIVKKRDY